MCDASASLVVRVSSSFSPPAPATQTIYESLEDEINLDNPVVSGFIPLSPAVNGTRKYSEVIHGSAMREELGSSSQHIFGVLFVLIPYENLEEVKEELCDFIFVRFIGEAPYMGRIIGIVNAIWSQSGPRIFVHRLSPLSFLLRVTNPRTRTLALARNVWIRAGYPMYIALWSPEFSLEEPQLTSVVVLVELRWVPYLLFNKQSLSRLATAIGKPVSLALETERRENFEVAKMWVRVNLLSDLPKRIVSGFSNGREVDIHVSYPWLPLKCGGCGKFGHENIRCPLNLVDSARQSSHSRRSKSS